MFPSPALEELLAVDAPVPVGAPLAPAAPAPTGAPPAPARPEPTPENGGRAEGSDVAGSLLQPLAAITVAARAQSTDAESMGRRHTRPGEVEEISMVRTPIAGRSRSMRRTTPKVTKELGCRLLKITIAPTRSASKFDQAAFRR